MFYMCCEYSTTSAPPLRQMAQKSYFAVRRSSISAVKVVIVAEANRAHNITTSPQCKAEHFSFQVIKREKKQHFHRNKNKMAAPLSELLWLHVRTTWVGCRDRPADATLTDDGCRAATVPHVKPQVWIWQSKQNRPGEWIRNQYLMLLNRLEACALSSTLVDAHPCRYWSYQTQLFNDVCLNWKLFDR